MREVRQSERWLKHRRYVLAFARADYRCSASGIEKYLGEEQGALNAREISCVVVVPFRTKRNGKLDAWLSRYWGVVADGEWKGFWRAREFANLLAGFHLDGACLLEIQLHHAQEYSLEFLASFLTTTTAPVRLFVHDYHAICAQNQMLRNGRTFCGIGAPSPEKCTGCASWQEPYYSAMRDFLERLRGRLAILLPSEAAGRVFLGAYPEWSGNTRVVPHWLPAGGAQIAPTGSSAGTLKIGFVGLPSTVKGWDVFTRVGQELANRGAPYEFFHFGKPRGDCPEFVRVESVSFVRDGREAMTEALRRVGVDAVVLWSIWPETYCYALYEALQAGTMILAPPESGNVADEIRRSGVGIVLDDEAALLDYLSDPARVRTDAGRCRRMASERFGAMVQSNEILDLISGKCADWLAVDGRAKPARLAGMLYRIKMFVRGAGWDRQRCGKRV